VLHKAFVILEALSTKKVTTINDISQMTHIPRSTVHRILQALSEEGVVTFQQQKGYVLTPKLISLGLNGITQKEVLDFAIPVMKDISERTKETVSINVICGHERVCIYRVEGDSPITRNIKIGDRGPLFRGSVGKVIGAGLSPAERDTILEKCISLGEIKESEVPGILRELQKVKEQGFAMSSGERIKNSASIAVPVKDIAGFTQAALSISTIAERMNEENQKKYLELLLSATSYIGMAQEKLL